jgi:signal transduction histidine kinase
MNSLITDLLDLARLQQDRLELSVRDIDVFDLVEGAVSLMRPLLDAREQRVDVDSPAPSPVIPGDLRRLERVLLNLLSNANKFAPAGTVIQVTVCDDEQEAVITVQDAGPGIAAEAIPHLFDQFFTDRTSSSEHNIGAGLGLPIAKGIVEAHRGQIWVESTAGAGTTVSFALPKVLPQEVLDEGPGRR